MTERKPDPHTESQDVATTLRTAAADELREAADHVEAGDDEEGGECAERAHQLIREAKQVELGEVSN